MNIINLDDMRPHYVIHTDTGVHIVPQLALEEFVKGQPAQGEILTK